MTYAEYLTMVHQRNRAADLIPSLLVLVLAVWPRPDLEPMACLSDGPQFACWLAHNPSVHP